MMAKEKNSYDHESYRKPVRQTRIKKSLADAAKPAMEILALDFADLCNEALREKLERMGLWPPPPSEADE